MTASERGLHDLGWAIEVQFDHRGDLVRCLGSHGNSLLVAGRHRERFAAGQQARLGRPAANGTTSLPSLGQSKTCR